jgi:ABC-type phosphate transport system substrate-binding protein
MDKMDKEMIVRNKIRCFVKLTFVMILLFRGLTVFSQSSSLTVISNLKGAPSSLTFSELKSIFMGEQQRWQGGTKITIALMKTSTPAGKNTSLKVYGMSGNELNKFWLALVFQGKAGSPNFFNSASELENFVAQNPGAIGILDQVASDEAIKRVEVEGEKL